MKKLIQIESFYGNIVRFGKSYFLAIMSGSQLQILMGNLKQRRQLLN